ncbi:MAG: hypothetical protein ACI8TX_001865 [Hyphomicrobiaceae bacterium]
MTRKENWAYSPKNDLGKNAQIGSAGKMRNSAVNCGAWPKPPKEKGMKVQSKRGVWAPILLAGAMTASFGLADMAVATDSYAVCEAADLRVLLRGKSDRDMDGLSNCRERNVVGTSHRNPDTDGDGVDDGTELEHGTDPLDDDSDDDGMDDGEERDQCTDPSDEDTDDDGEIDGDDADPLNDLAESVQGFVESLTCPVGDSAGEIVVLGIAVALDGTTEFPVDGGCEGLAEIVAAGPVHVEIEVADDGAGLVATEIEVEDEDGDGEPDDSADDQEIEGIVEALECAAGNSGGSIVIDGVEYLVTSDTVFDELSCEEVSAAVAGGELVEAEVEFALVGDLLVAEEVEVETEDEDEDEDEDETEIDGLDGD